MKWDNSVYTFSYFFLLLKQRKKYSKKIWSSNPSRERSSKPRRHFQSHPQESWSTLSTHPSPYHGRVSCHVLRPQRRQASTWSHGLIWGLQGWNHKKNPRRLFAWQVPQMGVLRTRGNAPPPLWASGFFSSLHFFPHRLAQLSYPTISTSLRTRSASWRALDPASRGSDTPRYCDCSSWCPFQGLSLARDGEFFLSHQLAAMERLGNLWGTSLIPAGYLIVPAYRPSLPPLQPEMAESPLPLWGCNCPVPTVVLIPLCPLLSSGQCSHISTCPNSTFPGDWNDFMMAAHHEDDSELHNDPINTWGRVVSGQIADSVNIPACGQTP